jgi:glycosyltransferase involved in cell wall biosynthesis
LSTTVSIIICTSDRAQDLSRTLESLSRLEITENITAELVVVDNKPETARPVVDAAKITSLPVRYIAEPLPGKSNALNTGIRSCTSEILVFTDDDLRVPVDWVQKLIEPILNGKADAVAGTVKIAPHLERDWMKLIHRVFLAEFLRPLPSNLDMTGNNMAFHRRILDKIQGFDTELGPGKLGLGEETLLSEQMRAAGFKIAFNPNAMLVHHFNPDRLLRESLLNHAERVGRSRGYMSYHYDAPFIKVLKIVRWRARYYQALWKCRNVKKTVEGCDEAEIFRDMARGFIQQFHQERLSGNPPSV